MTKLEQLLEHITAKNVYIQTHNFPDPDAIASAFGLQELLGHYGTTSHLCYLGKIDRISTNKMISLLGIQIKNADAILEMKETDEIILVDSQKGNSNIKDMIGKEIICLDHHRIFGDVPYRFKDIRPEIGACSSLITQYFLENKIPISRAAATALIYGIKVDTGNLTRGVTEFDVDMFYALYRLCDIPILKELEHSTMQFNDLHAFSNAIDSIKIYDNFSFANTGKNCPEALIAAISDFMLAIDEVDFTAVYSLKSDGIKLSFRSKTDCLDAGKIGSLALKQLGNGGGHASMAGGFVPYTGDDKRDSELISEIEAKILEAIELTLCEAHS